MLLFVPVYAIAAVEVVQRMLLEKADRARVDEIIESKYEEICNQLDKALASVVGEEVRFLPRLGVFLISFDA